MRGIFVFEAGQEAMLAPRTATTIAIARNDSTMMSRIPQNLRQAFKFLKELFKVVWSLFLSAACILDAKLKRYNDGKKYSTATMR